MTDLETRLDHALKADDPAPRDPMFRIALIERREKAAFRKQVEVSVPMPNVAEMTIMWSPATTALNKIISGTVTPREALDVAQNAVAKDVAALRKSK